MAIHIDCVTFDCADPVRLTAFWTAALGYTVRDNMDGWVVLQPAHTQGPRIGFQRVPESKIVKNRVHLDLQVTVTTMAEEVARLEALGGTVVRHVVNEPDEEHTVMQDPEGNEFCVVA